MPIAYPYKISDWYGYNKNCSTLTSFYTTSTTSTSSGNVCGVQVTVQLWHNGSASLPANGDIVYQNSAGTAFASWVGYKGFYTASGGNAISACKINISTGVLNSATLCP
tara:strand:- start:224 stop:550 length:327 start_codon:yes stop_codon:yes gene_type:complete